MMANYENVFMVRHDVKAHNALPHNIIKILMNIISAPDDYNQNNAKECHLITPQAVVN